MKSIKLKLFTLIAFSTIVLLAFTMVSVTPKKRKIPFVPPKGCVFRTVMGEESSEGSAVYKTPEKVLASVNNGLTWISTAQNENGGWGAGSHYQQSVMDPHAVE